MDRLIPRLACLSILLPCCVHDLWAAQPLLAIRGATLVDVSSGEMLPNSLVLIRGSVIERIGKTDQLEIPEGGIAGLLGNVVVRHSSRPGISKKRRSRSHEMPTTGVTP